MHPRVSRTFSLAALLTLTAAPSVMAQHVSYGEPSALGNGHVRTYLLADADGNPVELGIALDETALEGLPDLADKPDLEAFMHHDLALPEGSPAPYRFAVIDWNPRGHEPPGIYTVPHFDFHFYMTDQEARNAIMPTGDDFETRGMKAPEEGLMPANYINPGGTTVPMMGSHWIDPASHEFHGTAFDKTFIYGTWDGQVTFIEPMITKAYIEAKGDETIDIALPAKWGAAGWYPAAYRVRFDPESKQYRIALTSFAEQS